MKVENITMDVIGMLSGMPYTAFINGKERFMIPIKIGQKLANDVDERLTVFAIDLTDIDSEGDPDYALEHRNFDVVSHNGLVSLIESTKKSGYKLVLSGIYTQLDMVAGVARVASDKFPSEKKLEVLARGVCMLGANGTPVLSCLARVAPSLKIVYPPFNASIRSYNFGRV